MHCHAQLLRGCWGAQLRSALVQQAPLPTFLSGFYFLNMLSNLEVNFFVSFLSLEQTMPVNIVIMASQRPRHFRMAFKGLWENQIAYSDGSPCSTVL